MTRLAVCCESYAILSRTSTGARKRDRTSKLRRRDRKQQTLLAPSCCGRFHLIVWQITSTPRKKGGEPKKKATDNQSLIYDQGQKLKWVKTVDFHKIGSFMIVCRRVEQQVCSATSGTNYVIHFGELLYAGVRLYSLGLNTSDRFYSLVVSVGKWISHLSESRSYTWILFTDVECDILHTIYSNSKISHF